MFGKRAEPASASVDFAASRASLFQVQTRAILNDTLDFALEGRQDALSESNVHSARDGWSAAEKGPTPKTVLWNGGVARRIVGMAPCATPNETGLRGQTTPERTRLRTNMSRYGDAQAPPLRDMS